MIFYTISTYSILYVPLTTLTSSSENYEYYVCLLYAPPPSQRNFVKKVLPPPQPKPQGQVSLLSSSSRSPRKGYHLSSDGSANPRIQFGFQHRLVSEKPPESFHFSSPTLISLSGTLTLWFQRNPRIALIRAAFIGWGSFGT